VVTQVTDADDGKCSVQLLADLSNTRSEYLVGSGITLGAGAATTGIALVLGVMVPVAVVPALVTAPIAAAVARSRRRKVEDFQVALEQILDRLQHGEIDAKPGRDGPGISVLDRITEEIRKNF
jgi:hypothetical protein